MLATFRAAFVSSFVSLWDNTNDAITIYNTADLIEAFWRNAEISGHTVPPAAPAAFSAKITYSGFDPMKSASDTRTAVDVAKCFENALSTMVMATVLTAIPPSTISSAPIPNPVLPQAVPGKLTSTLAVIFGSQNDSSVAESVSNILANYLTGWVIPVLTPPATAAVPLVIL